ncbi:MAG: hypothetical protein ACD_21C00242G0008 [uncultured bacterium]|nr:MAG: hypothetical protein ACD_21C00242G0008 [uncultured bacterium]
MKLKPVVASLVVLGLMTPAFAHNAKSVVAQQAVIDQNAVVNTVCSEGWFNRITIGGMGSVVGIAGNTDHPGAFVQNSGGSDMFVNNVNLLANADLSKWSKVTLNLAYLGAPSQWTMQNNVAVTQGHQTTNKIFADEAYVTFADLSKSMFYLKVGKTYVPFGDYSDQYVPWQIESPAQMLSQTNGPTAILGLASDFGFYASIFALKGETRPIGANTNAIRNFGGKIGYQDNLSRFESPNTKVNVNLSYIRNVWDSVWFTPNTSAPQDGLSTALPKRDQVGGLSVHLDLSHKDFSAFADWTGALKNLSSSYDGATSYGKSSKFWGANINAAYAFETLNHDSSLGVGYQFSGNGDWFAEGTQTPAGGAAGSIIKNNTGTAGVGLFSLVTPKWRALAEYKVNLCKHTDLGLVYAHSKSYDISSEARSTNVGFARLAVRF